MEQGNAEAMTTILLNPFMDEALQAIRIERARRAALEFLTDFEGQITPKTRHALRTMLALLGGPTTRGTGLLLAAFWLRDMSKCGTIPLDLAERIEALAARIELALEYE